MIPRIKQLIIQKREFLLYAVIGLSGVLLDLGVFLLLFNVVGLDKNIANVISTSVGITNNFYWNSFHNFRVTNDLLKRFAKFYMVGVTGILLTVAIFAIFVDHLHFNTNIVKIGSLLPVLVTQYSINKFWTFRKKEEHAKA